jgi:hypothetical protein
VNPIKEAIVLGMFQKFYNRTEEPKIVYARKNPPGVCHAEYTVFDDSCGWEDASGTFRDASALTGRNDGNPEIFRELVFDSHFDGHGGGYRRISQTLTDGLLLRIIQENRLWTRANDIPSTSHVGSAGSTPAGITKENQGFFRHSARGRVLLPSMFALNQV